MASLVNECWKSIGISVFSQISFHLSWDWICFYDFSMISIKKSLISEYLVSFRWTWLPFIHTCIAGCILCPKIDRTQLYYQHTSIVYCRLHTLPLKKRFKIRTINSNLISCIAGCILWPWIILPKYLVHALLVAYNS